MFFYRRQIWKLIAHTAAAPSWDTGLFKERRRLLDSRGICL